MNFPSTVSIAIVRTYRGIYGRSIIVTPAERQKRVRYDRVWDEPAGTDPAKVGHYSWTLDGVELTPRKCPARQNGSKELGASAARMGRLVYQTPQEPTFADELLRGFWAYQADWFLEIAHVRCQSSRRVCLLGDIVQGRVFR